MAFSFGAPTPAPAFGAPAPAPAFGAPAPAPAFGAPAPAPGGLFGSTTPAPAPGGLFGSTTPAPAPGGLFGSTTPAPAPGGLFGSTAPAPAPGGLFGAKAPAPAGGGLFGAPAPAPGGLFGSTPAPAPGGLFGAPAPAPSAFGAAPAAVAPAANLAGFMPYSSLPQDQKNNLDTVHKAIMNHKRTILAVSTMAPKLLDTSTQQADMAGGGQEVPLAVTVQRLGGQAQQLESQLQSLRESMLHTKQMYETSSSQAYRYAKWPTEFVARRVGVALINNNQSNSNNAKPANPAQSSTQDKMKAEEVERRLQELLDREMIHTDQINRMPSPYLWQCIEEMEGRSRTLQSQLQSLKNTLDMANQVSAEEFDVLRIVQLQEQTIWKVAADLTQVHARMDEVRQMYNLCETGINVVEEARHNEEQYKRQRDQSVRSLMVKTLPTTLPATGAAPAAGNSFFGKSPAPAPGGGMFGTPSTGTGLFGKSPAPAPGGSIFGAPAPAPGGSLFGTPAPVPSGGLFGSTPAPAPSGGLFGSTTPAPAPSGGLFGSTPAPAPAFGAAPAAPAPAFGAAPAPAFGAAPAPATGGLFGSAPAPAPSGGLFGAAPAPGGLFGSTTATPKSKSKRNGSRRR